VTVVHDGGSGAVLGMAVGGLLGPMRCGGMTAVAVDWLSPPGPLDVTIVGAGRQAFFQLWALRAVRPVRRVQVVGRTPGSAARFIDEVRTRLGLDAAEATPTDLAGGPPGDVVILATSSPTPVLDPERIRPGQLLVIVGPKQVGRSEFSARLAQDADLIVTDSRAQVLGYHPPHVLADLATEIVELASVAASPSTDPAGQVGRAGSAAGRVLFLNVGLAGADAALLHSVL
jgi:alanine dehydrogenase